MLSNQPNSEEEFSFDQIRAKSPDAPKKTLSLADQMKVSLVINDNAEVILLHDQPFPFLLNWAEFDGDLAKIFFIGFKGTPLELGLKVPKSLFADLRRNKQITTVLMQDNTMADFYVLPLIVREINT